MKKGKGDGTREVQISVYSVYRATAGGTPVGQVGAPGDGGDDVSWRSGRDRSVYPAISVAVVTSLVPSHTVLNCSGTANSVWKTRRRDCGWRYGQMVVRSAMIRSVQTLWDTETLT